MKRKNLFMVGLIVIVLIAIVLSLPPVRDRLSWRWEAFKTWAFYTFFPPEQAVFVPQGQVSTAVEQTLQAATSTPSPTIQPTKTAITPEPTSPPTPTNTPLPPAVALKGVRYMDQHGVWNYCAPANLAMELSYWGWGGHREDTGKYLKPNPEDFNVMLYEMVNYVHDQTNLQVVLRYGGTLELLKSLVAAGFPVLIEKGTYIRETTTGKISWMGHYNVVTGYDDAAQQVITQDSYFKANYTIKYDVIMQEWRGFDNGFLVVYSPDKENQLMQVLGDYAGEEKANQIAAQNASDETTSLTGNDQFFAWFNRGTSLVNLQDYNGAAGAYDQAFKMYSTLPDDKRPFRIMWYQTGPYFAYYYTGRYQDVINLATTTLDAMEKPYLEESYYWRSRAKDAIGDRAGALTDLCKSVEYHPNFPPAMDQLSKLGATCP